MSSGLVGKTLPDSQIDVGVRDRLRNWVQVTIELRRALQSAGDATTRAELVRSAIAHESNRALSLSERAIALSVGTFYWCDRDDILGVWCETLSLGLDAETRWGMGLFAAVLRSFLQEPPGRTVWLPLKRTTTIAALEAFSPEARREIQKARLALVPDGEMFRAATAIACQLPWYSSACHLANRHAQPREACRIVGALHGAAFGTIAFQEPQRANRRSCGDSTLDIELAPLWSAWTGAHGSAATISPVAANGSPSK